MRGATVTMYHAGDNSMISADSDGNYRNFELEPYITTTDDFGKIYLYVLTPASSALGTSSQPFQAFSGSAYNTINVNMTCVDSDTFTTLTCN